MPVCLCLCTFIEIRRGTKNLDLVLCTVVYIGLGKTSVTIWTISSVENWGNHWGKWTILRSFQDHMGDPAWWHWGCNLTAYRAHVLSLSPLRAYLVVGTTDRSVFQPDGEVQTTNSVRRSRQVWVSDHDSWEIWDKYMGLYGKRKCNYTFISYYCCTGWTESGIHIPAWRRLEVKKCPDHCWRFQPRSISHLKVLL